MNQQEIADQGERNVAGSPPVGRARHRRCIVVRGTREATRHRALALLRELPDHAVLWVGEPIARAIPTTSASRVASLLGSAYDAIVLDLHDGFDGDLLGVAAGMIWGGGALVLRMPEPGAVPAAMREDLALAPYCAADVGTRFWDRLERRITASPALAADDVLAPPRHDVGGTDEQARIVARLAPALAAEAPRRFALLADRGRGKSSALGLALAAALRTRPELRAFVAAAREAGRAEIARWVPSGAQFVDPIELARGPLGADVVVIDEAAQLPVPLLQRIVRSQPRAKIALATTTRGYEGTGRGFVLRFLDWARREDPPIEIVELHHPIRWDEGDPLEELVHDVLALDAEPVAEREIDLEAPFVHAILDRDRIARDERLLRDFFGLLAHAHYRTSPGDLRRALDAPNLALHALLAGGRVVAASLVAREGGLRPDQCAALARGRARVRGHALADTLITHAARPEAGALAMIRSVRIAVHPALRRRGVARALVEHVHASYSPDLFGTMFGATPELVTFRRAVGYELVRVGASRGSRSGEPAAVMIRPVSEGARQLVTELRGELAQSLPFQLELLEADGDVLDPRLGPELARDLPDPAPLDPRGLRRIVERYLAGPQPFDAAAYAIVPFVAQHRHALGRLDARARALVEGRVLARRGWHEVARSAGYESVAQAMRALRPAIAVVAARADERDQ